MGNKKNYILLLIGFISITFNPYFLGCADSKSIDGYISTDSFSKLAELASPSVVNIRTEKVTKGGGPVFKHFYKGPMDKDDSLNDFFNKFFGEDQREFKQRSLGSGFILDEEGYIVTNNHVIEDADEIKVKLNNGKEFDAKVVGKDQNTDIGLIKLVKPEKNIRGIKLGDSDSLKVGEWVVAIGNPFGLDHTVTAGIISAKGRFIGAGPYDDFIQTDASINPGNSGGPLLNLAGEIIGINTAIVAGGQGIGFAIPINLAKRVIEQLKNRGEVTRGWIGVAIQDISTEIAEYNNIKNQKGVFVSEVFPGDPAEKAGILPRDVIISIDGKKVETSRELTKTVADIKVSRTVEVEVLRDGNKKIFKLMIAERQDSKVASRGFKKPQEDNELGVQVSDLAPEIIRRFNISDKEGVIVSNVEQGGKGDEAGLIMGDIIKEINHKPIKNTQDYKNEIKKLKKGESTLLLVKKMRGGFSVIKITK